ncbi:RNA-directed DNA polymerase, eukaryota [Tanacetum coccineum]
MLISSHQTSLLSSHPTLIKSCFNKINDQIFIDDLFLPSSDVATRWVKFIPIQVNVFSWRARRERLHTRVNLSRRGVLLDSHLFPLCNAAMEDVQHVFFRCDVARVVLRKICRWWDLDGQEICSFSDWDAWFLSFRLSSRLKSILEGVFYVAWWRIWRLRNQLVFDASPPNRSTIFDDISANPSTTLGSFSQEPPVTTNAKFTARINKLLQMRQTIDSLLFKTMNELTNQSSNFEIFCPEERIKELELRTQRKNNFLEELFKDRFLTEKELAYHRELLEEPQPPFSDLKPKIKRGDPWSLKIPCVIDTVYTGHAYIDL